MCGRPCVGRGRRGRGAGSPPPAGARAMAAAGVTRGWGCPTCAPRNAHPLECILVGTASGLVACLRAALLRTTALHAHRCAARSRSGAHRSKFARACSAVRRRRWCGGALARPRAAGRTRLRGRGHVLQVAPQPGPLAVAAEAGHADAVRALLAGGANVNARGEFGRSALVVACTEPGRLDVVRALLAAGADVNAASDVFEDEGFGVGGMTALLCACENGDGELVRLLLSVGADPTVTDAQFSTPLLLAVIRGHTGAVRSLVAGGADVNAACLYGQTPLIAASRAGSASIVRALLAAGANVNAADEKGRTALSAALHYRRADVAHSLRAAGGKEGTNPHGPRQWQGEGADRRARRGRRRRGGRRQRRRVRGRGRGALVQRRRLRPAGRLHVKAACGVVRADAERTPPAAAAAGGCGARPRPTLLRRLGKGGARDACAGKRICSWTVHIEFTSRRCLHSTPLPR